LIRRSSVLYCMLLPKGRQIKEFYRLVAPRD